MNREQATRIEPQQPATSAAEKGGCLATLLITGAALCSLYMIDWSAFL